MCCFVKIHKFISYATSTDLQVGAIAAQCNASTIINCTNTASISGKGIIGEIGGEISGNTKIMVCKNSGNMTSQNSNVGGIVGNGDGGLIIGCINKGSTMGVADVNGSEYAAGITAVGRPGALQQPSPVTPSGWVPSSDTYFLTCWIWFRPTATGRP